MQNARPRPSGRPGLHTKAQVIDGSAKRYSHVIRSVLTASDDARQKLTTFHSVFDSSLVEDLIHMIHRMVEDYARLVIVVQQLVSNPADGTLDSN